MRATWVERSVDTIYTDQFEVGAFDDGAQGVAAHVAGGELDDSSHADPLEQVGDGFEAGFVEHARQHSAVDLDGGAVDEIGCATE